MVAISQSVWRFMKEVNMLQPNQKITALYYNIAAKCDKETMLQREYTPDCMDKRNRYMVDHADYILAVWNGCPSGTGNTVRYAHKKGKSIIVINPVSLDVTRE